jgi:hypothetical protein
VDNSSVEILTLPVVGISGAGQFHEGIVSLMAVDYLENILVSAFGITISEA